MKTKIGVQTAKEDNVITITDPCNRGDTIKYITQEGIQEITAQSEIPFCHKMAIRDIQRGAGIIKYNQIIGFATHDIKEGMHVHVHNVRSRLQGGEK